MRQATEGRGEGISVKVATFGGQTKEVFLPEDSTVADALQAADISTDGVEVRSGGNPVNLADIVDDGDRVVVISNQRVKGGSAV